MLNVGSLQFPEGSDCAYLVIFCIIKKVITQDQFL